MFIRAHRWRARTEKLKDVLAKPDATASEIKDLADSVQQTSLKTFEAAYKSKAGGAAAGGAGEKSQQEAPKDGAVDAEFEDVKK